MRKQKHKRVWDNHTRLDDTQELESPLLRISGALYDLHFQNDPQRNDSIAIQSEAIPSTAASLTMIQQQCYRYGTHLQQWISNEETSETAGNQN